jgi:SAGA-associated factor 29
MRRGVLMSILQQASLTLPLWIGDIDESPPQLCGCIPHDDTYICKSGDKVAARVKNQDDEENWILGIKQSQQRIYLHLFFFILTFS